jgi:L-lysine 2,3-aminomutase
MNDRETTERYRSIGPDRLLDLPQLACLPPEERRAMRVVASVLPFRVNRHVIERLIRWDDVPEDPLFQLVFPQRGMLAPEQFERVAAALDSGDAERLASAVAAVRAELAPHPGGQRELNVPIFEGTPFRGVQHKYRETVLYFPAQGQTCHAYCAFCFRWPQFVGDRALRFADDDAQRLARYLAAHPDVSDLLVTGGDPLVMRTALLERHLAPLLGPGLEHVRDVRIGTKALTFWPRRFTTDADADDLLRLIERLVAAGRHVSVMAHLEHWRELDDDEARLAVQRLRSAGALIRSQAPVLRRVNDDAATWARTWREQVALGIVPYYMFVERDTGARRWFEVPLVRCLEIHRAAFAAVGGLARTARGPSMSAEPGKIEVVDATRLAGEDVFVLRFIQARDPAWVHHVFHARFDPQATWIDGLRPAFGASEFFFEAPMRALRAEAAARRATA